MGEDVTKIVLILMASGSSRRMGRDKLFLEIKSEAETETLLEHSLKLICQVQVEEREKPLLWDCHVVYQNDRVKALSESYGISTIYNENAKLGQSESVRLGAAKALERKARGVCYMTADQPGLRAAVLHRLAKVFDEVFRNEGCAPDAVIPTVSGEWLSPVIIGSQCLEALMELQGDQGAKAYLKGEGRQVVELPFEDANWFLDLDTPEDYLRFR